jgi:hypothetical protein
VSRFLPVLCLLSAAVLGACGGPATPPAATPPASTPVPAQPEIEEAQDVTEAQSLDTPSAAAAEAPPAAATPGMVTVLARVEVVDQSGAPLARMAPIVTRQPNAFDEPVSSGVLTGADGLGTVRAPANEHLYLRAWDPEQRYFANNYYDLLPGAGGETETLRVTMVEAGGFTAVATTPDGAPLAGSELRALLIHPVAGPWWPAKATTDANGKATFGPVPPGSYAIRMGLPDTAPIDLPTLTMAPGELADAGTVTLGQ